MTAKVTATTLPDEPADEDATQMDYYDEYSEWLCNQSDLHICNGHTLTRHFEAGTRFEDFLEQRKK